MDAGSLSMSALDAHGPSMAELQERIHMLESHIHKLERSANTGSATAAPCVARVASDGVRTDSGTGDPKEQDIWPGSEVCARLGGTLTRPDAGPMVAAARQDAVTALLTRLPATSPLNPDGAPRTRARRGWGRA
jgi:hypothetical protein